MAVAISSSVVVDRGVYSGASSYVAGDGVTFFGFDEVVGAGIRFVAKRSTSGNAPTLSSGDLNWGLAHASDAMMFFNTLLALAKSSAFMGAGQNWSEVYRYDGMGVSLTARNFIWPNNTGSHIVSLKRLGVTLKGPGLSGTESIYLPLVFSDALNVTATRNIRLGSFTSFVSPPAMAPGNKHVMRGDWVSGASYAVGDIVINSYGDSFPGYSLCKAAHTADTSNQARWGASEGDVWISNWNINSNDSLGDGYCTYSQTSPVRAGFHKLWNGGLGDIPFWIFANGNRLMWVTDSNGKKHFSYGGYFVTYGDPQNYGYPMLVAGNSDNMNDAYDSVGCHNFPLGVTGLGFFDSSGSGYPFFAGAGCTNGLRWGSLQPYRDLDNLNFRFRVYPFYHHGADFFNVDEDGNYFLEEALIFGSVHPQNSECGFCGQLDGLFYIQPIGLSPGNFVMIGGTRYWLFDDVFRGNSGGFFALKEA